MLPSGFDRGGDGGQQQQQQGEPPQQQGQQQLPFEGEAGLGLDDPGWWAGGAGAMAAARRAPGIVAATGGSGLPYSGSASSLSGLAASGGGGGGMSHSGSSGSLSGLVTAGLQPAPALVGGGGGPGGMGMVMGVRQGTSTARPPHRQPGNTPCKFFSQPGGCASGRHCKFLHGERDSREQRPPRNNSSLHLASMMAAADPLNDFDGNGGFLPPRRMGSFPGTGGQGGSVHHSFSSPALSSLVGGGSGGNGGSPLRRVGSRGGGGGGGEEGMGGGGPLPANARITPCRFHMRGYCRAGRKCPFLHIGPGGGYDRATDAYRGAAGAGGMLPRTNSGTDLGGGGLHHHHRRELSETSDSGLLSQAALAAALTGRTALSAQGGGGLIRRGLAGMARSSSTGYLLGLGFVDEEGDALTISQSGKMYDRSSAGGGGRRPSVEIDHEELEAAAAFAQAGQQQQQGGGGGGVVVGLEALSGDFGRLLAAEGAAAGQQLQGGGGGGGIFGLPRAGAGGGGAPLTPRSKTSSTAATANTDSPMSRLRDDSLIRSMALSAMEGSSASSPQLSGAAASGSSPAMLGAQHRSASQHSLGGLLLGSPSSSHLSPSVGSPPTALDLAAASESHHLAPRSASAGSLLALLQHQHQHQHQHQSSSDPHAPLSAYQQQHFAGSSSGGLAGLCRRVGSSGSLHALGEANAATTGGGGDYFVPSSSDGTPSPPLPPLPGGAAGLQLLRQAQAQAQAQYDSLGLSASASSSSYSGYGGGGGMNRVGSTGSLGSLGQAGTPARMGILNGGHGGGGGGGYHHHYQHQQQQQGVRVCRFFLQGNCVHGARCRHSHDPAAAAQQPSALDDGADPPRTVEESRALDEEEVSKSRGAECLVCHETVAGRFGLLTDCAHAFCLGCIRTHRQTAQSQAIQRGEVDPGNAARRCPVCAQFSPFVIPSPRLVTDPVRKRNLVREYRAQLARKPCKYSLEGEACPYGASCHYAHVQADGTPVPVAESPRTRMSAAGTLEVMQEGVRLADFLLASQQGGQGRRG